VGRAGDAKKKMIVFVWLSLLTPNKYPNVGGGKLKRNGAQQARTQAEKTD
jgi:hypothetical protein